ncbi:hypothetical protein [Rhizobium tumorigenes]|uniref:Uncharacterized protein n=1 Tax=Rhizobium tumorigenes TaxID=2041385 RepID=A0AAF1KKY5_9HYPH|nr:hypothetical protein [Rhizobium tumorigenes]WFR97563.1 hypothetical protein PR017_20370 [Rhizobium tumorigenes]WFS03165.1 hypothetical protein PR016_21115 [Rhizobium tumorigenes]
MVEDRQTKHVMPPYNLQRKDYRSLLEVMGLSVEMGRYGSLEAMIAERGSKIEALNAEGDVPILNEMRRKLAAGKKIEATHGRGALLNLDHEYILNRLEHLPSEQVENARRYRGYKYGSLNDREA